MFTTFHMGHYQPLSWGTLAADYLTWGMQPRGYHLTSLIIHGANALLFYFVSLRLIELATSVEATQDRTKLPLAAGFSALVFAIHPLRVESVVWATERRDVLSGLFFLSAVLIYLKAGDTKAAQGRRRFWWVSSLSAYLLSLLSKASGITLPLVLLILDVYPLRRWQYDEKQWLTPNNRKLLLQKIPYFALALVFGVIALIAQSKSGALKDLETYGIARRIGQAFYGLIFYLWKTIVPLNLSALYETPIHLTVRYWLTFAIAGVAFCAITAILWFKQKWPSIRASWIYYVSILIPVLGIAQSGPQLVADRYSYLSCLSWAVLCGGVFFYFWRRFAAVSTPRNVSAAAVVILALMVVLTLGALTRQQIPVWRNAETLWTHADKIYPNEPRIMTNLGDVLVRRGEVEKGIEQFREALRIAPFYSVAHNKLAIALAGRGKLDLAIEEYREAIRINPNYAHAHNNLGVALALSGDMNQAIDQFREALGINPNYEDAQRNLNLALSRGAR
jgi:tetratricopeptide (TPR) repeat protein